MMWKDHLAFNKRQRNGIIVLACIIVLMICWLFISDHLPGARENMVPLSLKEHVYRDTSKLIRSSSPKELIDSNKIIKLNINRSSIKELSKNPYIGYYLAEAIVNYREQHGLYKKVSDLLNIVAIDTATFAKLKPYLSLN